MDRNHLDQPRVTDRDHLVVPSLAEVEALVRGLVDVMHAGEVTELDLGVGPVTLRLRAPRSVSNVQDASMILSAERGGFAAEGAPVTSGVFIKAPMIGTFYAAPSPSSPQYVHVGDVIAAGQVIGIIEAMKIMNEITSDHDGVVAELLVENGEPVEYGTALVRLDPSGTARR